MALVSHVYELGMVEAIAIPQSEYFAGALDLRAWKALYRA